MENCQGETRPIFDESTLTRHLAWRIEILFEKMSGYWPYQNKILSLVLITIHLSSLLVFEFGLLRRMVLEWNNNFNIVIENIETLVVISVLIAMAVTAFVHRELRREVLERVALELGKIDNEDEVQIIRFRYNRALRVLCWGIGFCACPSFIYFSMPICKAFFVYYFGQGSLEIEIPIYVDYFVENQNIVYYIVQLMFVCFISGTVTYVGSCLNVILCVNHSCALFDIVKLRLKRASEIFEQSCDQNNKLLESDEDNAYQIISSAVDLHNRAFEIVEIIDEIYHKGLFILLILNMIGVSPVPAMVGVYLHDSFQLFRHAMALLVFPANFYLAFLQGQLIIDHSSSVFDSCYEFCWYNASKRSQSAILIIMMRSMTPSHLTGANLFELSMETYSVMFKTAISYCSMVTAFVL